ncbi:hypothetical protein ES703_07143 [subsurface metagenome]
MPDCYLLAVAKSSTIDSSSNNFSLYELIESVHIETDQTLEEKTIVQAPFEVHVYWYVAPEERGIEYEWRLVAVTPDGEFPGDKNFQLKTDKARHRFRLRGLPVFLTSQFRLEVEWRKKGNRKWARCYAYWPLDIEYRPSTKS